MFSGASNFAESVDGAFLYIFGISFFFLIGLTIIMIWFVVKYNRNRHPKAIQIKEDMRIEIAWLIIPIIIVLSMFYYGYIVFRPMRDAPLGAMEVKVTGRMWDWTFEYENGKIAKELYLPVNKPVRLNLYSPDVIHSFYISAFRIKEDIVPGKNNYMWFIPTIEGSYDILCAEYCGLRHSYMESKAVIISDTAFSSWLAQKSPETNESKGLELLRNNACISCHSLDGSKLVGPSFKDLFNSRVTVIIDDVEKTIIADTAYIRRSITDPDKEIVKGYNKGMMRAYKSVIKDEDIQAIVDYFVNQEPSKK
jgi:cytochrome c oxidase subunit II